MSEKSTLEDLATASLVHDVGESVSSESGTSNNLHHIALLLDAADMGDALAQYCSVTGADASTELSEPNTIKQAYTLPDRQKWREAVNSKWDMVNQFGVLLNPMPLPQGAKAIGCRWVFKRKRNQYGNVIKDNARLTPQSCYQYFGIDYSDTYAPVARMTTLRYVLALAALLQLHISSLDFTNAFLNAPLYNDVYILAPPGTPELPQGYVYKLQKALYGLKQSPRECNSVLNQFMVTEWVFIFES